MTDTSQLHDALIEAWRSGTPLNEEAATRLAPADNQAAYRVQHQVGEALQWFAQGRPHAWKIGAASNESLPTAAPIADAVVIHGLPESPAQLPLSTRHTLFGIEVELAIRLARDLPASADAAQIKAAVAEVIVAIEVCDVRAQAWQKLPATFRLADQQMNRWLILGNATAGGWQDDYAQRGVQLQVNGAPVALKDSRHPLGDPLCLLPWLCNHVAEQYPAGLRAGDVITTGTWTGLYEAQPGDRICASFDGLGGVALNIANA
ncbi:MAG: hypothetical protein CMK72_16375 [Pseudomonadaceae bacterium]|nr:hypothetical protein [Pseudomonadaceae bacterium]HCP53503.1 hypothetical protein [Pseudomonas sp.]